VLGAKLIELLRIDPICHMAIVGYQAPPLPATPNSYSYPVDLLDYLPSP
jgi:hypothetical protein